MIVRAVMLSLFVLGAFSPVTAWTQEQSAHERMMELSEEGTAAYEAGRYESAAKSFARAYEIERHPYLLKNEAIAWLKAGAFEASIDAASRFLVQEDAEATDVAEVRKVWANAKLGLAAKALESGTVRMAESLIVEVERSQPDPVVTERVGLLRMELDRRIKQIEDAQATERERERALDEERQRAQARAEEMRLQREIESKRAAEAEARTAAAELELERERGQRQAKTFGFITAGTAGALLVANVIYHFVALGWERQFYELAENGGDAARFEQLRDRLSIARVALPVLYTIGAVGVGVGAYVVVRADRVGEVQNSEISVGARWVFR